MFGDGKQTRDYVFVKDVARANVLATTIPLPAATDLDTPAFNIATSKERDVLTLADAVGRVLGCKPEIEFAPPRPGELFRSSLDNAKAKRMLGWSPAFDFEYGLRELVGWFRQEAE